MVNKVVTADKLVIAAMELDRHLASSPTKAIGLAKKVIYKSLPTDLETSLDYAPPSPDHLLLHGRPRRGHKGIL